MSIKYYDLNLNELLKEPQNKIVYNKIRKDYLYSLLRSTTMSNLYLPQEIIDVIEENYSYKLSNFITPNIENEYNNLEKIVNNIFLRYYICKIHFDLSYDDYKFIYETDTSDIEFDDENFEQFIKNIKDIQNGYFSIYSNKQKNIKHKLLSIFNVEMNSNIIDCNFLHNLNTGELNEFGLNVDDDINIKDSGLNFCFLIKDLSYATRPYHSNMTYKEYYNFDESDFLYDSKSLVSNSIFTCINVPGENEAKHGLSAKHLMVGYNKIYKLNDASSADLANETINGVLRTNLKTGKNVKHLCSTKKILYTAGVLKDDNKLTLTYNEIVDSKYDDKNNKIQPDYIVFAVSSNENSVFSKNIDERFKTACIASKQFEIPIVFVNLDKIIKNEYNVVCEKISEYKKNNSKELLEEILQQIRMNRTTDYGSKLFTDAFINNLIIELYVPKYQNLFYEYLNNMPNFNIDIFKRLISLKIHECNDLLDNSCYNDIFTAEDLDQISERITETERNQLLDIDNKIVENEKRFFKTKKVKANIFELNTKKNELKKAILKRIKLDVLKQILNNGIYINDLEFNINDFKRCMENAITRYKSIIDIFYIQKKEYSDITDKIIIDYQAIDEDYSKNQFETKKR